MVSVVSTFHSSGTMFLLGLLLCLPLLAAGRRQSDLYSYGMERDRVGSWDSSDRYNDDYYLDDHLGDHRGFSDDFRRGDDYSGFRENVHRGRDDQWSPRPRPFDGAGNRDFLYRPKPSHPSRPAYDDRDGYNYWDYSVEFGPSTWDEKYPECAGLKQSPVALPTKKENHTFIRRLGFYNYEHEHELYLQNNGHQIDLLIGKAVKEENAKCGGSIFPPKQYFELHRIEFHWGSESTRGSEHTMHGRAFPGEIQFVHFDKRYKTIEKASKVPGGIVIAVILMKVVKEDNENLNPILDNLHRVNGTTKPFPIGVHDLEWLYPTDVSEVHECEFYMYEGSYTSPPCSQVVYWHIYRDQTGLSERQLNHLRSVVSPRGRNLADNYRPMQPTNDRKIWQFRETIHKPEGGKGGFSNFVRYGLEDDKKWMNPHHARGAGMHNFIGRHDLLEEVYDSAENDGIRNVNDQSGFTYTHPYNGPLPDEDQTAGGYGR